MSTTYRKSRSRGFYKVDEATGIVTRVWNNYSFSRIDICDNRLVLEDTMDEGTKEITAEEFNTAYKEAMERIQSGVI